MIFIYHLIAITLAVLIDKVIGDPRNLPHPVVWIGKWISIIEKRLNQNNGKKLKGYLFVILVILPVFTLTYALIFSAYEIHIGVGVIIEGIVISFAIAQRSLKEAAIEVLTPLENQNMMEARLKLSYIVGRDTEDLDESDIVRGTVETVAENTSDGITAPLFYALIGGAPLAFLYRAVNTCDSMVGYRNEKFADFGWASAKLDDVLNLVPSRITGVIMILINRTYTNHSKKECFRILYSDAKKHPSPNSGWGEAAVASLLGVQLGGRNSYHGVISYRATMGIEKQPLEKQHIPQAISIMNNTVYAYVAFLWLIGGFVYALT